MVGVLSDMLKGLSIMEREYFHLNLPLLLGMNRALFKRVQIDGLDEDGIMHSLYGDNEDEFLLCVADCISMSQAQAGNVKNVKLCRDYSRVIATKWGMNPIACSFDELKSDWGFDSFEDVDDSPAEQSEYFLDEGLVTHSPADDVGEMFEGEGISEGENTTVTSNSNSDGFIFAEIGENSDISGDTKSIADNDNDEYDDLGNIDGDSEEEDEEIDNGIEEDAPLKEIKETIQRVFGGKITAGVETLLRRYNLLFSSGYDLERPYGLLSENGILYVDSDSILKVRDNSKGEDIDLSSVDDMHTFFMKKMLFDESQDREYSSVAATMYEGYVAGRSAVHFPRKLLEYAYGRSALKGNTSDNDSNVYKYARLKGKGVSSDWGKFKEVIEGDIRLTIVDCVYFYCDKIFSAEGKRYTGDVGSKSLDKEFLLSMNNKISAYIMYIVNCLSTCIIITKYNSTGGKPVTIKLRVCDPLGKIRYDEDIMSSLVGIISPGHNGGSSSSNLGNNLPEVDSKSYKVYEYGYEFDHTLANGLPLFAYKALEVLQSRGSSIDYNSLILGQSSDGTILRNGTHGLSLGENLFHYIIAGSRSGKGVMTLNILIGALLSNKAIIYIDNKPDIASILSLLAGGSNELGPKMFTVQGNNWEDDRQGQFKPYCDGWINHSNIPIEAISLFGKPAWVDDYGVIFYMRALTLAMSIIFARGRDGGHGHMSDPEFNGKDGIFLVCDEINKLQNAFSVMAAKLLKEFPPMERVFNTLSRELARKYGDTQSENARKNAMSVYDKAVDSFTAVFSAAGFYALSLVNMFKDNISYIDGKSKAGFLKKENSCSDILLIGQGLDEIPMSMSDLNGLTVTDRYSSEVKGAVKTVTEAITKGLSIPLSHFVFSSSDALIGYNNTHTDYLAQKVKGSKANGKLDEAAGNFCYLPSMNIKYGSVPGDQLTLSKANDPSSVYFKPYLIINECDEDNTKEDGYVNQMYTRVSHAGVTKEDMLSAYGDGNHLDKRIALIPYCEMLGISDLPDRLSKGANIANLVLSKYVKYPDDGSGRPLWLQFITDLRPEWMLSITDIVGLCCEDNTNVEKGDKNPILSEYYTYVNFVASHPEYGIIDKTMTMPAMTEDGSFDSDEQKGYYISEERKKFYDDAEEPINEVSEDSSYDSNVEYRDLNAEDDGRYEVRENNQYHMRIDEIFGEDEDIERYDTTGISENDIDFNDFSSLLGDDFGGESENTSESVDKSTFNAVDEKDEVIAQLIAQVQAMQMEINALKNNGNQAFSVRDEPYRVSDDIIGVDMGYDTNRQRQSYCQSEFGNMRFGGDDDDVIAGSYASLIGLISRKVLDEFGGLDRISSFKVSGGAIIVNESVYRSEVNKDCLGSLPLDLRRKVNSGNLAELFDYRLLKSMRNLRIVKFDSKDFILQVVSPIMGYRNVAVGNFFDDIPSLISLRIASKEYVRDSYKKAISDDTDLVYRSNVTKFFTAVDSKLSMARKGSWKFTKNMYKSSHNIFVKSLGILAGLSATAVTGAVNLGAKASKGISGQVDRRSRVKSSLSSLKGSISDLFNT